MPLGKMNIFGNQQSLPQQYPGIQPGAPGQFSGNYPASMFGRGLQRFGPMQNNPGGFLMPPGSSQMLNRFSGGMPSTQGIPGRSPLWEAGPRGYGRQAYPAPGYPPVQQPLQNPMPSVQSFPPQGYPFQNYTPQVSNPQFSNSGFGAQMPVQPAWEGPKKGGIKGFISNLLSKKKK